MKIRVLFVFALIQLIFTSCQITETIHLDETGGGKIAFDVDASAMMEMAGDKLAEAGTGNIDSTFTFKELLDQKKDSISKLPLAEQERLKRLSNMSVSMKLNDISKEFKISVFTDFKKADELQDMMAGVKTASDMESKSQVVDPSNPMSSLMDGANNTDLKYSYDGKTFKRQVKIKDVKLQQQSKDSTGMFQMLFAGSSYTMKYYFPRKVKSVSNPEAIISEDKKMVSIPYSMADYFETPEKLSFDVVLEK